MNDFLDKLIGYLIIGVIGTIFLFPYIGRRKQTKEELRESSIEKIKKEKNLDIQYEINKEGVVIFKKTKEKINQIVEILKDENNKITEIYLGYNDLGPEGAKALAEALKNENNKVTEIYLGRNDLGPEGAKALAEALKNENNKVTEINLGLNNFGPEGGKYLEEVKKIRPEIKIIY